MWRITLFSCVWLTFIALICGQTLTAPTVFATQQTLKSFKIHRRVILGECIRGLSLPQSTHLKAHPLITKHSHTELYTGSCVSGSSTLIQSFRIVAIDALFTHLVHLRAPGELWIKFWMVGSEKPKKSTPVGMMLGKGLPLRKKKQRKKGKVRVCCCGKIVNNEVVWND